MRIYEINVPNHEIGEIERFLGFANNATEQYLWLQRDEGSENEVVADAGNVWIERDDQRWGGYGGITRVKLTRDTLNIRLTSEKADELGGVDELSLLLSLNDDEFDAVRRQLELVFVGYENLLTF